MRQGFLKAAVRIAALVLAAAALGVAQSSPAQAFGGETFGCRISPGFDAAFRPLCFNTKPAPVYNVAFVVQNLSGDGYTFSWDLSGSGSRFTIISGCGATDSICGVSVRGGRFDSEIYAAVTFTQGGQTARLHSTAIIVAYCGLHPC